MYLNKFPIRETLKVSTNADSITIAMTFFLDIYFILRGVMGQTKLGHLNLFHFFLLFCEVVKNMFLWGESNIIFLEVGSIFFLFFCFVLQFYIFF